MDLDKTTYFSYKLKGMTDRQIAKKLHYNDQALIGWKNENNISHKDVIYYRLKEIDRMRKQKMYYVDIAVQLEIDVRTLYRYLKLRSGKINEYSNK